MKFNLLTLGSFGLLGYVAMDFYGAAIGISLAFLSIITFKVLN